MALASCSDGFFSVVSASDREWFCAQCAALRFSSRGEPYLSVRGRQDEFILTPARTSDATRRIEMAVHESVDPWVMRVPKPYTLEHEQSWTNRQLSLARDIFEEWRRTAVCPGVPFSVIRTRATLETPIERDAVESGYAGDFGLGRETSFEETHDPALRETLSKENASRPAGHPEIVWTLGYMMHPDHVGKGLMTDALKTLMDDFAVPTAGVRKISSHAFVGNEGSRRVHLKLGFKQVGGSTVTMPPWRGGQPREQWDFDWIHPQLRFSSV